MKTVSFGSILLLVAVLSVAVTGQQPSAPPVTAIRYVSSQRVLTESTDARAELARFQATQQQRNSELRARQQALDVTRQKLIQAGSVEDRTPLLAREQQERIELERATSQAQSELAALQRQMQVALQARVKAVLDDLLKGQNVQLVLNADTAVVWAAPGSDLTATVIERLNTGRAAVAPAN